MYCGIVTVTVVLVLVDQEKYEVACYPHCRHHMYTCTCFHFAIMYIHTHIASA